MAAPTFATGDVPTADQFNNWFVNTKFARKAANTPRSSTITLTDDPDLQLTGLLANSAYHATAVLHHQSAPAGDLAFQFLGPSGSTFDHIVSTLTAGGSVYTDDNTYSNTVGAPTTSGGITGVRVGIMVEGLLVTAGSGGSFKLQWAQGTSSASSSTLLANSFLLLRQVS